MLFHEMTFGVYGGGGVDRALCRSDKNTKTTLESAQ